MNKFILKNKLLATTAICAISVCANTVKAEEISILDILNNSTTKSPNITWEQVTSAGENTIQIGEGYYKYTYTTPEDYTKVENLTENISVVNPTEQNTYKYIGLGVNNPSGTDYDDVEKYVFSNNKVTASLENNTGYYRRLYVYGGVVSNQGTIGDITADFINNSIETSVTGKNAYSYAYGGAISNSGTITSITGDFTGNRATSTSSSAYGGAIYNEGTITSITGDFIGNSTTSTAIFSSDASGGAIYNKGTIESITGDFTGNSATLTSGSAYGGAIYNDGTIGDITGDFIGNTATSTYYEENAEGGAIHNSATIETITGDFTGNSANSTGQYSYALGGAIFNKYGTISSITGDFINNSAISTQYYAKGGAIYNYDDATIETITGDFIGNGVTSTNDNTEGGAIYNYHGTISSITGDFTGNSATSTNTGAYGGAIYNYYKSTITSITGDFIGNSVTGKSSASAGAIYNYDDATIETITGDFINNSATSTNDYAQGGAIHNSDGTIETITGDFVGNSATSTSDFAEGGAIFNYGTIESITGDFINNSATSTNSDAQGGAIHNRFDATISSITGDFIGNSATSTNGYAQGGAIYNNESTINILADGLSEHENVLFKNNYIQIDGKKQYEAIYNISYFTVWRPIYEGTINFNSINSGFYTFYDYINGDGTGFTNFIGDGTGTFNLYNNIQNQKEINFQSAYVMNMISPDDIHQDVFTSKYSYIQAKNININAALQMMLDVDLEAKEMDRFEADNFTISATGSIDVTKFNIVTDVTGDIGTTTEVDFIVSDNATGLENITNVTEAVGEVYTYSVTFNPDTGAFEFVSTGLAPNPVTPAPEEVAPNQAPSLSTNTTVAVVDTVIAQIFDRDVTISTDINYGADTTDYMETSDGVNIRKNKSVWVKTFGSDDDVEVDNFNSTIDAESYGVVGGVDSKVFKYDNGVKAAYGVYGAYVGGKQKYNDSKIEQKSGYLGVSAAFRKSNLFSNFTLNGGYITSEANTAWGKDKFDTKVVSIANKTGVDIKTYNNWKITPALYVAYTGMDTEDYTNKAGVKMENEFSNVITIAPELKVSNRIGKDLDGYAKVSYKHYIYDAEVRADDVLLEEMSAKPYVEYGFGVEKNWADKSGYAEITRRSGGREGWNVNLGLNFYF